MQFRFRLGTGPPSIMPCFPDVDGVQGWRPLLREGLHRRRIRGAYCAVAHVGDPASVASGLSRAVNSSMTSDLDVELGRSVDGCPPLHTVAAGCSLPWRQSPLLAAAPQWRSHRIRSTRGFLHGWHALRVGCEFRCSFSWMVPPCVRSTGIGGFESA